MKRRETIRQGLADWTVPLLVISLLSGAAAAQKTTQTNNHPQPAPQRAQAPAPAPQRQNQPAQPTPPNRAVAPPQQVAGQPQKLGRVEQRNGQQGIQQQGGQQQGGFQRGGQQVGQQPGGFQRGGQQVGQQGIQQQPGAAQRGVHQQGGFPQGGQQRGGQPNFGAANRQQAPSNHFSATNGATGSNGFMHAPSAPVRGEVQRFPDGRSQVKAANGTYGMGPDNRVRNFSSPTAAGVWRPNGNLSIARTVHDGNSTLVVRGAQGMHTIDTTWADGTRIVNYGPHTGFVQQPIAGRQNFYSRTSVSRDGTARIAIYHSYTAIDHRTYYRYVPSAYYRPAFYGWAARPWGANIGFSWGAPVWGSAYGAYFTPYAVYPSASFWLTDYVLNANLQAAYAERQAALADPGYYAPDPDQGDPNVIRGTNYQLPPQGMYGPAPAAPVASNTSELPQDVKTLMSKQAGLYLASLQQASANVNPADPTAMPPALADNTPGALNPEITVFQISTDTQLDVSGDQTCVLTPGDVLLKLSNTPDANGRLPVTVVGTKPGDCLVKTAATMTVASLDEINNQTQQQWDAGLAVIAAKNGTGPLPASPNGSTAKIELASAQADPRGAQSLLDQNQQRGQQTEVELTNTSAAPQ